MASRLLVDACTSASSSRMRFAKTFRSSSRAWSLFCASSFSWSNSFPFSTVEGGTSGSSKPRCVAIEGHGIWCLFVRCGDNIEYMSLLDATMLPQDKENKENKNRTFRCF